jgi:protein involved in polysaccharide export with SLBB domain
MRLLLVAMCGLSLHAGCAARDPTPAPTMLEQPAAGGSATPVQVEYRLGVGDKLRVIVFGEESLSGEFVVDGNGAVALPLIGGIQASGLTIREFEQAMRSAYADGYVRDPRVSVEIMTYRPFYILGEVRKPGEYSYRHGLTVISAVAAAEGFTYRANTSSVLIDRPGHAEQLKVPASATSPVLPGDVITVRERFF